MIPHSPQSIEQLRARFPLAMRAVYSVEFCQRFPSEGPSYRPEHTFDFIDNGVGFRVMVSVDEIPSFGLVLHASVSCSRGLPCLATSLWAFSQIYGPGVIAQRGYFVSDGVTHLIFDLPERAAEVANAG